MREYIYSLAKLVKYRNKNEGTKNWGIGKYHLFTEANITEHIKNCGSTLFFQKFAIKNYSKVHKQYNIKMYIVTYL